MSAKSNAGQVLCWGLGALIALVLCVVISLSFHHSGATRQVAADVAVWPAREPWPQFWRWVTVLMEVGHLAFKLLVLVVFVKLWTFLWLVANKESDLAPQLDGRPESDPLPRIVHAPGEDD